MSGSNFRIAKWENWKINTIGEEDVGAVDKTEF